MRRAVGKAGDHYVAHPHGDVCPSHCLHKLQGAVDGLSGYFLIALRLVVFHVVEYQVGVFENVLVVASAYAGGVDAGVNPFRLEKFEALQKKVGLPERLAAGEGDPSAGRVKVGPEAEQPLDQSLRCGLLPAGEVLGVRIVAVEAAQRAALEKDHSPHTRAIHQPHALQRMNKTSHGNTPFLPQKGKKGRKKAALPGHLSAPRRSAYRQSYSPWFLHFRQSYDPSSG